VRELQVILARARKVQGEERAFVLRAAIQSLESLSRLTSFLVAALVGAGWLPFLVLALGSAFLL